MLELRSVGPIRSPRCVIYLSEHHGCWDKILTTPCHVPYQMRKKSRSFSLLSARGPGSADIRCWSWNRLIYLPIIGSLPWITECANIRYAQKVFFELNIDWTARTGEFPASSQWLSPPTIFTSTSPNGMIPNKANLSYGV